VTGVQFPDSELFLSKEHFEEDVEIYDNAMKEVLVMRRNKLVATED
jgi:hypothetical protein